jgi:hypothetical protein
MAESNHRSYCDPAAARSAQTPLRGQPDDPLGGLARLLAQTVPMNGLARDARHAPPGSGSAREFNPRSQHGYAAPDDVFQETSEEQYSTPEQTSYDFDSPNDTHDDERYEPLPLADASRQSRSDWYELELPLQGKQKSESRLSVQARNKIGSVSSDNGIYRKGPIVNLLARVRE